MATLGTAALVLSESVACRESIGTVTTSRRLFEPTWAKARVELDTAHLAASLSHPLYDERVAPPVTSEVWRFTTLVTGGPEPLHGSNGYYELELAGSTATVRQIGHRGQASFPPERVLEGRTTMTLAPDPTWPGGTVAKAELELESDARRRTLNLKLWFSGDTLHGTWVDPSHAKPGRWGRAWGLLRGTRGPGAPVPLENGAQTPCEICVDAYFTCEGSGPGGCNSSFSALDECTIRRDNLDGTPLGCLP